MRPHVELIDEKDLLWHPAELTDGTGDARQRNLAYDEEDGSASLKVHFDTDWSRPGGVHSAETEWFVLSGQVRVGEHTLNEGGYWQAPIGVYTPPIEADAGTEILLFREYGDWTFEMRDDSLDSVRDDQEFTVVRSKEMDWTTVELGSPMRFDLGGSPVVGLHIKMLHRDDKTGFYTRLIKAEAGWIEHQLAHHPCYEEAYCLEGEFEYNWGTMWPGTYFFRPALIRHGDFSAGTKDGCTWILRCDGDLVDWYTEDGRVEMTGNPLNWGPELPHTIDPVLVMPVRSRSIPEMEDPSYQ